MRLPPLHEAIVLAISAQEDIRRLDISMHESARFGFGERMAHLTKDMDDALGGHWPEALDHPAS
jgi:hypothetical protein